MSDFIVGPNPCSWCGGEYGDHHEDCNRPKGATMTKKKSPTDATIRNTQAANKKLSVHNTRLKELEKRVKQLEKIVKAWGGELS